MEAREILLKRARDHNDEKHICDLLKLCGGVPLLLELAGAQLAKSTENTNIMVLELLKAGEKVEKHDISDRMVDYVYRSLLQPVKEAFLDSTSFLYSYPGLRLPKVNSRGEEEFRALEEASFIKRDEYGLITIHDIVQARGKMMSEQEGNRITHSEVLLDCLKDAEKLKNLKGICFRGKHEQPPIEIDDHNLKCMSNSLRVLSYEDGSQITWRKKSDMPFKELRCLRIPDDISELPMEFEKLEHLAYYRGPFTQAMSLYELPPSLRSMYIKVPPRVTNFKVPPRVTSASSLVELLCDLNNRKKLPDGMEKLTKLERLYLRGCDQLRELPSKFGELRNLRELWLEDCKELKELPSDFGRLSNLERLWLRECPKLKQLSSDFGQSSNLKYMLFNRCSTFNELSYSFGQLNNLKAMTLNVLPTELGLLKNLEYLDLRGCTGLKELPCDLGQLQNLQSLRLRSCSGLQELPSDIGQIKNLKELDLGGCSGLKELPCDLGQLQNLQSLRLMGCSGLQELPYDIGQLQNLKELDLRGCRGLKELPLSLEDLVRGDCKILFH